MSGDLAGAGEAEGLWSRAANLFEGAGEWRSQVAALRQLAAFLRAIGRASAAEPLLRRCLAVHERVSMQQPLKRSTLVSLRITQWRGRIKRLTF